MTLIYVQCTADLKTDPQVTRDTVNFAFSTFPRVTDRHATDGLTDGQTSAIRNVAF